jgi:hypothetical protein
MSRWCSAFALLLSACGGCDPVPPDPLEGHWQGTCEDAWRVTGIALDLTRISDFASEGPATVDLGFGPQLGTARLVVPREWTEEERLYLYHWQASLVVTVEGEPSQIWARLNWTRDRDQPEEHGFFIGECAVADDGIFESLDCYGPWWALTCDEVEVRWDGRESSILAFGRSLWLRSAAQLNR